MSDYDDLSSYDDLIASNRRLAESLQRQLAELNSSYQSLLRARAEELRSVKSYINMKPIEAARIILAEEGPMPRAELEARMIAGGITEGKKRAEHNVRIGIDTNLKLGNLVDVEGAIRLPERHPHAPPGDDQHEP